MSLFGVVAKTALKSVLNTAGTATSKVSAPIIKPLTSEAQRGSVMSSPSDYIDYYYGPNFRNISPSAIEQKILETGGEKAAAGYRKIKGATAWGADAALSSVNQLLNPYARALYKETGVNLGSKNLVKRHLTDVEKGEGIEPFKYNKKTKEWQDKQGNKVSAQKRHSVTKDIEKARIGLQKAIAQINYNSHILRQSGREGPVLPALDKIAEKSNWLSYLNYEKGSYKKIIKPYLGKGVKVNNKMLDKIEDHFGSVWENNGEKFNEASNPILVIKKSTPKSGNHQQDILARNDLTTKVSDAFLTLKGTGKNVFKNDKELYKALEDVGIKPQGSLKDVNEKGVWVSNSKVGSAIVEGGINILMKVEKDGRLTAVMSDEHDFLEKLPFVGKILNEYLPNRLVAVTPPLHGHIKRLRKRQIEESFGGKKEYPMGKGKPVRSAQVPSGSSGWEEVIKNYLKARPSKKGVIKETAKVAGVAGAGAYSLFGGENNGE